MGVPLRYPPVHTTESVIHIVIETITYGMEFQATRNPPGHTTELAIHIVIETIIYGWDFQATMKPPWTHHWVSHSYCYRNHNLWEGVPSNPPGHTTELAIHIVIETTIYGRDFQATMKPPWTHHWVSHSYCYRNHNLWEGVPSNPPEHTTELAIHIVIETIIYGREFQATMKPPWTWVSHSYCYRDHYLWEGVPSYQETPVDTPLSQPFIMLNAIITPPRHINWKPKKLPSNRKGPSPKWPKNKNKKETLFYIGFKFPQKHQQLKPILEWNDDEVCTLNAI